MLILPNLPTYGSLLQEGLADEGARRPEAEKVLELLVGVLGTLREGGPALANGHHGTVTDDLQTQLTNRVGEFLAGQISEGGDVQLAHAIVDA